MKLFRTDSFYWTFSIKNLPVFAGEYVKRIYMTRLINFLHKSRDCNKSYLLIVVLVAKITMLDMAINLYSNN
jgi:hypothetical protein